jgi:beta-glucanase (GH16 family)
MSTEPSCQTCSDGSDFQYGYFEARMRWDPVRGNGPAFWLFSTRHAMNPNWPSVNLYCALHSLPVAQCYSGELDVSEAYGGDPTVFTGTLHRNSCNCYGVNDSQTANSWQDMGHDMSGWHVVAAKWTPTLISWYVDGQLVMSDPPYDSTAQPMHLLLYNWNTDWEASNTPNTQPSEDAQFDWVRVWQQ